MRSPIKSGLVVPALTIALLVLGAGTGLAGTKDSGPTPETRLIGVVNINTANHEVLELLPGIGPARARAIIARRKSRGPFKQVADLTEISGIGERALERIRPHCVLAGKTTAKLER